MTNKAYGFESTELQEFVDVIFPWIKKGYANAPVTEAASMEEVTTAIKDKKYVYVTSNLYSWESTNFNMTNDVKITFKSKRGFYYKRGGSPYIAYRYYETPVLSPYDYIVIQFQNSETINGKIYKVGDCITVPALYAYMAADYGNDQILGQKIELVINVALTIAGVGEVRAALKTPDIIRKVLAVTDLVVQTADVAINTIFETQLKNSGDAGVAFLKSWAVFTMVYGGTSVVAHIQEAALDAYVQGRKVKTVISEKGLGSTDDIDNALARCLTEGGCFLPNTPIATPTGFTPIQNITIGTLVNTYDEATQQNTTKPVTNIFTKTTNKIYDIIVGKDTLHATPEHPFYTNGKWTIAQNLRKGMQLLTLAGALLPISQINAHDTLATVHNFEVQDAHTYYVGKQQVLVHNLCGELEKRLLVEGFSPTVVNKLKNATIYETKVATEIGEILSRNKALFDKIPANKVDDFLNDLNVLTPDKRLKVDGIYINAWNISKGGNWFNNLKISRPFVLTSGSNGRTFVGNGVANNIIDAKEIALSDKIGASMNENIVHPSYRDYPAIDAVSEVTGTPLSYKQLEAATPSNISSNINDAYKQIVDNNAKALNGRIWKNQLKYEEWYGVDLHIEYPFNNVNENWLNSMWPAFARNNQRAFRNDGTIKQVYIHLFDGSVAKMDMSILKF